MIGWLRGTRLVPIVVVIAVVAIGLYVDGRAKASQKGMELSARNIFGQADSYKSLLWGSLLGCVTAIVMAVAGRILAVREAMEAGSVGFSTGLIYPPCSYADEDEMAALCAELVDYGGFIVVHMRNEDAQVFVALDEMLRVSVRSGALLHISHL